MKAGLCLLAENVSQRPSTDDIYLQQNDYAEQALPLKGSFIEKYVIYCKNKQ